MSIQNFSLKNNDFLRCGETDIKKQNALKLAREILHEKGELCQQDLAKEIRMQAEKLYVEIPCGNVIWKLFEQYQNMPKHWEIYYESCTNRGGGKRKIFKPI